MDDEDERWHAIGGEGFTRCGIKMSGDIYVTFIRFGNVNCAKCKLAYSVSKRVSRRPTSRRDQ